MAGKGRKCGKVLRIKVLGYADDLALVNNTVEAMTKRLTKIADASKAEADMEVSMPKTYSQHVYKRKPIKATGKEVKKAEMKYKHKCDFCPRRFKTESNMMKHRAHCIYNYGTTEEIFEIEKIVNVFGFANSRWFLVKWIGYEEPD